MRKGIWPAAAVLVLILSGTGLSVGRALAANGSVGIEDKNLGTAHFTPAEITITPGASVTWHNGGEYDHTVTSDNGAFGDKDIPKGADVTIPFPNAGDFKYHCTPHPWMTGTIHVVGASTGTTATTVPGATPTSATTAPSAGASSTTTTATTGAGATTTTTAAVATTTTAPAANASTTPTSSADQSATTTTTAAAAGSNGEQASGTENSAGHRETDTGGSSPIGIAFAAVATFILLAVSAKLLASKGH
ncbi:MAG TPA: plastocyanin/azurin family copper-binding protein [Acidimicrobiia bacterium]|nr:plastocyanin/azurin family copper-binding protein [Acidimicrobiia bacterium]